MRHAARVLGEAGHRVDLLTLAHGEDIDLPNVTIHRARRAPLVREVPIGPSVRKLLSTSMLVRPAFRMVGRTRYDVVHGVEDGALLAWWLHRRTGVPFVYDMDSHLSAQFMERGRLYRPAGWIAGWLERRALSEAGGVLAVCPALARVAERYRAPETVRLLPDGPLQDREPHPPSPDVLESTGTRIVYVGNLEPYQGIDLLLQSFRTVAAEHPEAELVIVGGSSRQIERYSGRFRDLVEAGRLRFLGPRPLSKLGSILAAADVLASPRLQGVNTPMKIYSYLASGRPVVATRLRTHTQVLDDDVAVLVAPEPEHFAEGLSRLLGDAALRAELGEAGREMVFREYGSDRFRQRLEGFYQELASRIDPPPAPEKGALLEPVS